jgi:O-antigen/teichoic acid export membrane protein
LAGLAGAYLAAGALTALGGYAWLRARFLAPRLSLKRAAWVAVLREALPLGGAVVLSIMYTRTAIFALDRLGGVDSVGLYGVAQKLTEPLAIIPAALLAAVFPALSQALARPGGAAARLRRRTLALLSLAGGGIALAGLLGAPWLIAWLYSGQYAGAEPVLQVLALAVLPAFINYALTHFLVAQGRQHLNLIFSAVILVLNTILCLVLIPQYGATGAALAVAISESVLFALCWGGRSRALQARTRRPEHGRSEQVDEPLG